jgi:hypothetical protein
MPESEYSDRLLRLIELWIREDPGRNTPFRLSFALDYKSNNVAVWLSRRKVPAPARVGPYLERKLDELREENRLAYEKHKLEFGHL